MAQQSGASCASIGDDAERLACYDSVFRGSTGLAQDEIVIISTGLIPAIPTGREPATMTVACVEGEVQVRFDFARQQLSSGAFVPLSFQLDQSGSMLQTLPTAPDNRSAHFANAQDTEAFLDSLLGGTNLRVRVTPLRQRSLALTFRLTETAADIAALRAACGPA